MTAFPDVVPSFNILIPSTWFFSISCMWLFLQNLFPYDLEIYSFEALVKTKFHELNSCCRAKKMFAGELRSIFSHLSFLYVVITSLTLHILVVVKFVYPCPTLCDPTDSGFSRPEYWNGQLFPSPGDLPKPGIKPRSSTLQVDSLPSETPGKPFMV